MNKEKTIYVYADFPPYCNELIGTIYVSGVRGKENYAFEYELEWIETQCTYLIKRFDRNDKGRIHFASAMTLLGKMTEGYYVRSLF